MEDVRKRMECHIKSYKLETNYEWEKHIDWMDKCKLELEKDGWKKFHGPGSNKLKSMLSKVEEISKQLSQNEQKKLKDKAEMK